VSQAPLEFGAIRWGRPSAPRTLIRIRIGGCESVGRVVGREPAGVIGGHVEHVTLAGRAGSSVVGGREGGGVIEGSRPALGALS
jgi:hypothetical protein